jgi:hypothetical protein
MTKPSPVKRGLTLAWSIGLGIVLIGVSTVLLLPATKSARIRIEDRPEIRAAGSQQQGDEDQGDPDTRDAAEQSP